jgi:tetrahydrodipicolinate N-succinyltransferase
MDKEKTSTEDVELQDSTEVDADKDESTSSSTELDLDAEIEAEKKRGKPDPEIAAKAFEEREAKRKAKVEETEDDEDKPLTLKDLARVRQEVTKEVYGDRLNEIAHSIAESPKEAELALAMHANRRFPDTMSFKDQVQEMLDLVQAKKLRARNGELARAIKGKDTVVTKEASSHRDGQVSPAPKLSSDKSAVLKELGFAYDAKEKVYTRKLPNGKTEVKDNKGNTIKVI